MVHIVPRVAGGAFELRATSGAARGEHVVGIGFGQVEISLGDLGGVGAGFRGWRG